MFGIAWGNEKVKGMKLGDVLVASSLQDFDLMRVGASDAFRSPETQAGPKWKLKPNSITEARLPMVYSQWRY